MLNSFGIWRNGGKQIVGLYSKIFFEQKYMVTYCIYKNKYTQIGSKDKGGLPLVYSFYCVYHMYLLMHSIVLGNS